MKTASKIGAKIHITDKFCVKIGCKEVLHIMKTASKIGAKNLCRRILCHNWVQKRFCILASFKSAVIIQWCFLRFFCNNHHRRNLQSNIQANLYIDSFYKDGQARFDALKLDLKSSQLYAPTSILINLSKKKCFITFLTSNKMAKFVGAQWRPKFFIGGANMAFYVWFCLFYARK